MSRKNIHVIQKPSIIMDDFDVRQSATPAKTLHVDWCQDSNLLTFSIYSNNLQDSCPSVEGDWEKTNVASKDTILLFWQNLGHTLDEVVKYGEPDKQLWNEISLKLSSMGNALFKDLLPESLRNIINQWPDDCFLGISTNEQWIPWELMYDAVGFWGERFKIARYPRRINPSTALERTKHTRGSDSKKLGNVVNVIGGDIPPHFSDRAKKLFGFVSDDFNVVTLEEESAAALVSLVKDGEVLHFTCHGHLNPQQILQVSSKPSILGNLDINLIRSFSVRNIRLVFINACSSNVPIEGLSHFSSFGWEFYIGGVEVCIGTLGTIPTEYALEFAEDFYSELFAKSSRIGVMEAFSRAKRKAAKRHNFFWLLYSVYGDTSLKLSL